MTEKFYPELFSEVDRIGIRKFDFGISASTNLSKDPTLGGFLNRTKTPSETRSGDLTSEMISAQIERLKSTPRWDQDRTPPFLVSVRQMSAARTAGEPFGLSPEQVLNLLLFSYPPDMVGITGEQAKEVYALFKEEYDRSPR